MADQDVNLKQLFDEIGDEQAFLRFARALLEKDLSAQERETFSEALESAIEWAETSNFGSDSGLGPASPWKKAAAFLLAGTVLE